MFISDTHVRSPLTRSEVINQICAAPPQCGIIRLTPAESVAGINIDLTGSCAHMYLWTWVCFILVSAWPDWGGVGRQMEDKWWGLLNINTSFGRKHKATCCSVANRGRFCDKTSLYLIFCSALLFIYLFFLICTASGAEDCGGCLSAGIVISGSTLTSFGGSCCLECKNWRPAASVHKQRVTVDRWSRDKRVRRIDEPYFNSLFHEWVVCAGGFYLPRCLPPHFINLVLSLMSR